MRRTTVHLAILIPSRNNWRQTLRTRYTDDFHRIRAVSLSSASHRAVHVHCVYQDDVAVADSG
ncbi:hypothetical protein HMPREF1609_02407, partial [Escherichia coli 908541]